MIKGLRQMVEKAEQNAPTWERHIQSILTALVLAGVLWLANTANENAKQIGIMAVQMVSLNEKISDLKIQMNGSVSADRGLLIESRIDRLEEQVSRHNADGHGGK